ncbi:MAG: hypothetical protein COA96_16940 [SAR86 cluster bacterium]|uniref:Uncharacterized protein n=1 Tax=SAR86 cluster bacterium TaxID=2030880 RepID=A0A2A5AGD3_9GAMM|nr:MAG: hypothetical protein COA96_16940 [SAR86 cluster bacterium]
MNNEEINELVEAEITKIIEQRQRINLTRPAHSRVSTNRKRLRCELSDRLRNKILQARVRDKKVKELKAKTIAFSNREVVIGGGQVARAIAKIPKAIGSLVLLMAATQAHASSYGQTDVSQLYSSLIMVLGVLAFPAFLCCAALFMIASITNKSDRAQSSALFGWALISVVLAGVSAAACAMMIKSIWGA